MRKNASVWHSEIRCCCANRKVETCKAKDYRSHQMALSLKSPSMVDLTVRPSDPACSFSNGLGNKRKLFASEHILLYPHM